MQNIFHGCRLDTSVTIIYHMLHAVPDDNELLFPLAQRFYIYIPKTFTFNISIFHKNDIDNHASEYKWIYFDARSCADKYSTTLPEFDALASSMTELFHRSLTSRLAPPSSTKTFRAAKFPSAAAIWTPVRLS